MKLSRRRVVQMGAALASAPAAFAQSRSREGAEAGLAPINADPNRRILLKGGTIVSMDASVGDFVEGDILIQGKEIAAVGANVKISGPAPRVIDVRGTERAAEVLAGLASPGAEGSARGMFGPEQVRELAVARFEMVVRDVVGHPTAPGSTWVAADPDPAVKQKTMTVDRLEPCGTSHCARISAQYDVDPRAAAKRALRFAAAFLARNGVDPAQTEVLDASLDYRDELLLEPGTLVDHAATFSQTAKVIFAGPQGKEIPVELRTSLEQSSTFP